MTQKEKAKFRKSKEWKEFRKKMAEKYNNKDAITGRKLYSGWNLHHLDTNPENYTVLDENNFIPLNKKTHDLIHTLFHHEGGDDYTGILERLGYYLRLMKSLK